MNNKIGHKSKLSIDKNLQNCMENIEYIKIVNFTNKKPVGINRQYQFLRS